MLGLGVEERPGSTAIQIGSTRLELEEDPVPHGVLHLALRIPEASFRSAKQRVSSRTVLLSDGISDEFEASASWDARSVYLPGPDGMVLELIAHRRLVDQGAGVGPAKVISISEVGVAVPDVPAAARALQEGAGVEVFGQDAADETFAPVGTAAGLIILVAEGRNWFPTTNREAGPRPLLIEAVGADPGRYRMTADATLVVSA